MNLSKITLFLSNFPIILSQFIFQIIKAPSLSQINLNEGFILEYILAFISSDQAFLHFVDLVR